MFDPPNKLAVKLVKFHYVNHLSEGNSALETAQPHGWPSKLTRADRGVCGIKKTGHFMGQV